MSQSPEPAAAQEAHERVPEEAFERWIDAFRGPLIGLVASWGSDWAAAEELAVDTFAEAWMARARFEGDPADLGAVGAWLRGIAFRLRSASRRKRRPVPMAPEDLPVGLPGAFTSEPDGDRRHEVLAAGFAELKPEDQNILRMKYLEETTAADVAALLGLSTRAVEGRLQRARGALRVKVSQVTKKEVTI